MPPFVPSPVDPRLYALLAEAGFGDALFNPRQHRSCELVEHYVLQLAIDLVARLELAPLLAEPRSVDELLATRGFVPRFAPALGWLLERLALAGVAAREAGGRYRLAAPLPAPVPAAVRAGWPGAPLAFAALDVNQPWAAQDVGPASVQLVWGVNVFHLARDLEAVLAEARTALVPGGWLVIGEGLRPRRGEPVGAEFPFPLLASFTDGDLDPVTRATPGFLTAEEWLGALARTGFTALEVVPDAVRLRAYHAGMWTAAVCGRRPLHPPPRSETARAGG